MKLGQYIKDKLLVIIFHIVSILAISLYMRLLGITIEEVLLCDFVWILCLLFVILVSFLRRKRYLDELLTVAEQMEKRYLLADVMEVPQTAEDEVYQRLLYLGNKSMLEEISKIRHEREEYKDYIEQWVHEIKTPIAAMKLICENDTTVGKKKLLGEIERANHYVEQVLYYARSESTWKDYLLKETELEAIVRQAILSSKTMLREHEVQIELYCRHSVYTDSKWIVFMLEQCIMNSCQYGATKISFYSESKGNKTRLSIKDNGIGIRSEDLSRIFEKGFTGNNGRRERKSTGIGLYLCKKLCDQLDVGITANSVVEKYTVIQFEFASGRITTH